MSDLHYTEQRGSFVYRNEPNKNQRDKGPVNAHLISLPSKAQNIQNLENKR